MARIKVGDIFEIITPKGRAYLHYIHKDSVTGELIRVLQGLYAERPSNFNELISSKERYIISFPLTAATVLYYVKFHLDKNDFLFFNNGDEGACAFDNIDDILANDIYGYRWVESLPFLS